RCRLGGEIIAEKIGCPLILKENLREMKMGDWEGLTLAEVEEHALSRSPRILAAEKSVEQAEGQKLASLSGYLPHLTVSEVFNRGNDPVFAFGTKLRQARFTNADFSLPSLNEPAAINNYATAFLVEQPIFNGGKSYYGRKQAAAFTDAAVRASRFVRDRTLFQTRQAYYSVILARENLQVIESALSAARSHCHQAERMLDAGMVTRADVLKTSVRESELEQQRIRAGNAVIVAVESLKLAAGWRGGEFLAPSDTLVEKVVDFELDSLIGYAVVNHGQLSAARDAARAAEYGARAAWGEVLPHLNGFFQYQRDGRDVFGGDGDHWMAGVALEWKFFDGLGNAGRIKSKKAEREKAAYEAALMHHQVEVSVREVFFQTQAAKEMIAVAREARKQARESLRILENQYREGLATITDLLDTELASTNSNLSLVKALYEYNVALARLSLVTGGYPEVIYADH
ncbi:MAG: TolC family protein, partial [Gemmatimonadota bacterium]|nr:TolC family protein [Gemmatimonadota bacterium]